MTNYFSLIGSLVASIVALSIAVWNARRADRLRNEDRHMTLHDGEMRAILLTLPGNLATVLRIRLKLNYTVTNVPLDPASLARLREDEKDSGHKWLIFDRASAITGSGFEPRSEWIEAELAYDIAGLRGGDQDAVLAALKLNNMLTPR